MVPTDTVMRLPPVPARLFLVGIGGIGVSALAQLLHTLGYAVAGSDRMLTGGDRDDLFARLRRRGIPVYPQDGSGPRAFVPDVVVRSAAVEADNPDLAAAAGIPVFHRADALAQALNRLPGTQIGVAGSCGKTTVTAWVAETLRHAGESVLMVGGGFAKACIGPDAPGNFAGDTNARWVVYEVDESDASLVAFTPHIGAVLNVGTDHFDRCRLLDLFRQYVRAATQSVVVESRLQAVVATGLAVPVAAFAGPDDADAAPDVCRPSAVTHTANGVRFDLGDLGHLRTAQFGDHAAANAAATVAIVRAALPRLDADTLGRAVESFSGVVRRFDRVGRTPRGATVYDDYAHNVEKIVAAIRTARQQIRGRVVAVFQPHGYAPLQFMREPLAQALADTLNPDDVFILLPVYYAGGTTGFHPTAREVAGDLRESGISVLAPDDRQAAAATARDLAGPDDAVLVMGGRDPTLGAWSHTLTDP